MANGSTERGLVDSRRWLLPVLVVMSLLWTLLGVGSASKASAANLTQFNCQPGYIYSMQATGNIVQIDPSGTVSTVYTASGSTVGSAMNGLGIGKGGTSAYWYERSSNGANNIKNLVSWSSGTATVGGGYTTSQSTSLVAGAIDLLTGDFLFGQYSGTSFYLYAWVGTSSTSGSFKALGSVAGAADSSWSSANGDIAFDGNGDLFLLASSGSSVMVTEVNASDLATAITNQNPSAAIPGHLVSSATVASGTNFNGVAFDSNGYAYLGTGTALYKYDTTTKPWTQIGTSSYNTTTLGSSTDLASCGSPSTLTVQKNLPNGRYQSGDQFTLGIAKAGTTVTSNTTTGSDPGIQGQIAGPTPVITGSTYVVSEAAAGTTVLSNYNQSLSCVDTANGNAAVSSTSGNVTIPTGQTNSPAVVCTFTNTPIFKPATVTISKQVTDASGNNPTAASGWVMGASLSSPPSGVAISPSGTQTTGTNGSVPNPWSISGFTSLTSSTGVTVSETSQAGYAFLSGSCTITHLSGSPTTVTLTSSSQTLPGIVSGDAVSCGFVNKPVPSASVTISKQVTDVSGNNATGASGWVVGASLSSPPSGVAIAPTGTQTTGTSGSVPSPWSITGFSTLTASTGVTVSETQQAGYTFLSGSCVNTHTGGTTTTTALTSSSQTLTGIVAGDSLACSFTNKPTAGTVTWSKVTSDSSKTPLAGSTWTLTGPGVPSGTVVTDCTTASCPSGAYTDQDSTAGGFKLTGLAWGAYTLTEASAPVGYKLDTTQHSFTISGTALNASVGQITDSLQTVPVIPLTGGSSVDGFLIGGGGLLAAAGCAMWLRRRRMGRRD